MLSLDDLQLLEAVRATGSLSRAADRLGKAASTVSMRRASSKNGWTRCCSTVPATASR